MAFRAYDKIHRTKTFSGNFIEQVPQAQFAELDPEQSTHFLKVWRHIYSGV